MNKENFTLTCPIPISDYPRILLAHGGGGKLMNNLINKMFISAFGEKDSGASHDSAVIESESKRIAFTTDSYVVSPLFFSGGDIGSMAVYGTVNDLAMSGARPHSISVGFIIEEGLEMEVLWKIVQSMKKAADKSGVKIVTGDTKVVDKGKGDGIFINTSGIGFIEHDQTINPLSVEVGDVIILNGDIGRHGMTIMSQREGLSFESKIESDSAPVSEVVQGLVAAGVEIHCLRDLTRGGLASALNEIASSSKTSIKIEESSIPVHEDVKGACEILGFDPIYVANEGRFIAIVPKKDLEKALEVMKASEEGKDSVVIGEVIDQDSDGIVTIKSVIGVDRIVDMISGEQLPRIC